MAEPIDPMASPVVWAGGFAGALVSAIHTPGGSVVARFSAVVGGTLAAGFTCPAATEYWTLTRGQSAGVAFLVGLIGMALTAILANAAARARDDPALIIVWVKMAVGIYRGDPAKAADPPKPPAPGPAAGETK